MKKRQDGDAGKRFAAARKRLRNAIRKSLQDDLSGRVVYATAYRVVFNRPPTFSARDAASQPSAPSSRRTAARDLSFDWIDRLVRESHLPPTLSEPPPPKTPSPFERRPSDPEERALTVERTSPAADPVAVTKETMDRDPVSSGRKRHTAGAVALRKLLQSTPNASTTAAATRRRRPATKKRARHDPEESPSGDFAATGHHGRDATSHEQGLVAEETDEADNRLGGVTPKDLEGARVARSVGRSGHADGVQQLLDASAHVDNLTRNVTFR